MSPDIDFNDLITRAIAICTETITGSEGVAFADYNQEAFPYFSGRIGGVEFDKDGEEVDAYDVTLIIRHISGQRTEGVQGEAEETLNDDMPLVIAALLSQELLQGTTYTSAPDWLEYAGLEGCAGLQLYQAAGTESLQVGTEYRLLLRLRVENDQLYE